ncbi:MAG: STAS domain-containing protein [Pirellulales bacterium]
MSTEVKSFCLIRDGYSVVTFPKELSRAHLNEIREAGDQVVAELASQKAPQCIVDLTNLDHVGSSMVASIVRIWKAIEASQGRMIVAASSIGVREVLRVTGLNNVWTIKSSYDQAVHELGFSPQAKIVKRELRLLAFVGPATLLVGGVAAALCRVPKLATLSEPHEWIALSLIAMASVTSGISVFREHSWRRWLSVFVFIGSVALLAYLIWTSTMLAKLRRSQEHKSKATINQNSDDSSMTEGDVSTPVVEGDAATPESGEQASDSGEQAPQSRRPKNPPATSPDPGAAPSESGKPAKTDGLSDNPDSKTPNEGDDPDMPPPDNTEAKSSDPAESGSGDKPTQAAVEKP